MKKYKFIPLLLLLIVLGARAHSQELAVIQDGQHCNAGCGLVEGVTPRPLEVDLANRCMCTGPDRCFKIDIGKNGPSMTTSGTGVLHEADGTKYQTLPDSQTKEARDQDAIAMGIPGNDVYGKWIHKTVNCRRTGGHQATLGCIAVPCQYWAEVKSFMGRGGEEKGKLVVCGGNSDATHHVPSYADKPSTERKKRRETLEKQEKPVEPVKPGVDIKANKLMKIPPPGNLTPPPPVEEVKPVAPQKPTTAY